MNFFYIGKCHSTYASICYLRWFLLSLVCSLAACSSQRLPDTYGLHKVRLTEPDRSVVLEVVPVSHEPGIETDRLYYWYSGGQVHSTQGGYSGKLLNGPYSEYYTGSKGLKTQGQYKSGLKAGTWRSWNEDGSLHELSTWKNGYRSGTFSEYDSGGKLLRSGNYRHDLLQGKVLTYAGGDSVATTRYKGGKLVEKKAPVQADTKTTPLWRRYWPFKKHTGEVKKVKTPKPPKIKKSTKLNAPDITAAP